MVTLACFLTEKYQHKIYSENNFPQAVTNNRIFITIWIKNCKIVVIQSILLKCQYEGSIFFLMAKNFFFIIY